MEYWAKRERATNRLARAMAEHVLSKRSPTGDQLYALAKLAWITDGHEGEDAPYIKSTKIPALGELLGASYDRSTTLATVRKDAKAVTGNPSVARLINSETGFTNFYKPYRNSVREWVQEHRNKLLPLYRSAFNADSDLKRLQIAKAIASLPGIPKANHSDNLMKPEFFLTPVFFMLDPEIRFPIINGNKRVQSLLTKLGVHRLDIISQYRAMTSLYGKRGIRDAADLDQLGENLTSFFETATQKATRRILKHRGDNERDLSMKDESDYSSARDAATLPHRRIHNQLTNALRQSLATRFTLLEGINECKFDVVVARFDDKNDLLIEAKSSANLSHLRMAVGQLYSYWFQLQCDKKFRLAVLLPSRPSESSIEFLKWMSVGVLWFDGKQLTTCTVSLKKIAQLCKM